jgi:SNF2 family DNA or RNA helicase
MPLWEHQKDGVEFIKKNAGSLLYWGMGSGKSRTTIEAIKAVKAMKTLIICPKQVIPTWASQFKEHSPDEFNLIVPVKGTVKKKAEEVKKKLENKRNTQPHVVVINYETVWRPGLGHTYKQISRNKKIITDKGLLRKIAWDLVVVDEAQKIKAAGSSVSMFMKLLNQNSRRRVGLTGTPMPNSPLDIYGIYRFLDPSIFGTSFQRFRMRYAEMGGFEMRQVVRFINQDELNRKIFSIASRVKTEEVLKLPDFEDIYVNCELSSAGRKAYNEFLEETIIEFQNGKELTAANAMVKNLRLAQIASGIVRDDEDNEHIVDTSKLDLLKELLLSIDEPAVIFTRFRTEVREIRKMIEAMNKSGEKTDKPCQIASGIDERNLFSSGKANICIANLQSGGTGLNELVRARYAFYYSTGYSLGDYEQSKGRIRRPGSKLDKTVMYYHLIAQDTIDEVIKQALKKKQSTIEAVVEYFARRANIQVTKKKAA